MYICALEEKVKKDETYDPEFPVLKRSDPDPLVEHFPHPVTSLARNGGSIGRQQSLTPTASEK